MGGDVFERRSGHPVTGRRPCSRSTELQTPLTRVRSLAIAATAAVAVFGTWRSRARRRTSSAASTPRRVAWTRAPMCGSRRAGEAKLRRRPPFSRLDAAKLAAVPGVTHVGVYRGSFLDWGTRRFGCSPRQSASSSRSRRASSLAAATRARVGSGARRRLGGAFAGARRRTPPARRGGVHAASPAPCDLAGRGTQHEPRLAARRDDPELRATTRGRGEQATERI